MYIDLIKEIGWQAASFIVTLGLLIWIIKMAFARMDVQHKEHREDRQKDDERIEKVSMGFTEALKEIGVEARMGHDSVKSQLNKIEGFTKRSYINTEELVQTLPKEHERILNKLKK